MVLNLADYFFNNCFNSKPGDKNPNALFFGLIDNYKFRGN